MQQYQRKENSISSYAYSQSYILTLHLAKTRHLWTWSGGCLTILEYRAKEGEEEWRGRQSSVWGQHLQMWTRLWLWVEKWRGPDSETEGHTGKPELRGLGWGEMSNLT